MVVGVVETGRAHSPAAETIVITLTNRVAVMVETTEESSSGKLVSHFSVI